MSLTNEQKKRLLTACGRFSVIIYSEAIKGGKEKFNNYHNCFLRFQKTWPEVAAKFIDNQELSDEQKVFLKDVLEFKINYLENMKEPDSREPGAVEELRSLINIVCE